MAIFMVSGVYDARFSWLVLFIPLCRFHSFPEAIQPAPEPRQSGLGIASFVISIVFGLGTFLIFGYAGMMEMSAEKLAALEAVEQTSILMQRAAMRHANQ